MQSYLIEFRFQSKRVNTYLRGMIYNINRKFRVGKRKHVPHISLVGPFTTNNERKLISDLLWNESKIESVPNEIRVVVQVIINFFLKIFGMIGHLVLVHSIVEDVI